MLQQRMPGSMLENTHTHTERERERVVLTRARAHGQDLELRPVADDVLRPSLYVAGFAAAMAALNSVDFVPAQANIVERKVPFLVTSQRKIY